MSRRSIVVLAALALAGCGSEPRLSPSTAAQLHKDVATARAAAQAGDADAASSALGALERHIDTAEQDGQVSAGTAAVLRRGAARARRRAAKEIAPPQPTPEATSTPTPSPLPTPEPPGHGNGKGKAKGHHKGAGDQGDEG